MHQFTEAQVTNFYLSGQESIGLTQAGLELLERLFDDLIKNSAEPRRNVRFLYLTGGIPGSGKGAIVDFLMRNNSGLVVVDPDLVKVNILEDLSSKFPTLNPLIEASTSWAAVVHEVSSFIARQLGIKLLKEGSRNLLYDATMATKTMDWYPRLCKVAADNDFSVHAYVASTSLDEAIARAGKRATNSIVMNNGLRLPGRLVPRAIIDGAANYLPRNIVSHQQAGLYESCWYLYPVNGAVRVLSTYLKAD